MDSLTQIVLGAATAEFVAGRKLGNRAMLYGAVLGTIPDLDVFVGRWYDIVTANEIHRGFSHSVVFYLLIAPLLSMAIKRIEKKVNLTMKEAFSMTFFSLLTHPLLDAFTNWGTQLFWPFEERIAIQSIFVIDPLYTLPFIYCLIRAMRLKKDDPRRYKWNRLGLIISSSYLVLTLGLQAFTKNQFADRLVELNIAYDDLTVRPAPLQAVLWNADIATADGYYLGEYSFFDTQPISYQFFWRDAHLLGKHSQDEVIKRLVKMSEGWYAITKHDGKLYFNDLRFGLMNDGPKNPEFVFRYELVIVNGQMKGIEAESPSRENPGKLLKRLWKRIRGN